MLPFFDSNDKEIKEINGVVVDEVWKTCDYRFYLNRFGIERFVTASTIYGDWSCTVYEVETKKELGYFCSDAGLVTVVPLSEILKVNPSFSEWLEYHKDACTVIPDFTGEVRIIHGCRDNSREKECWVEGSGIDNMKDSEENI